MKLLFVSPRFAPCNGADTHRVRGLLRPLADLGCDVTVLACSADLDRNPQDPWLIEGLDQRVEVIRVNGIGRSLERIPGLGSLSARCYLSLHKKGLQVLRQSRFDWVVFSTTEFPINHLGVDWKKKTGTPFVIDYQDPWTSNYYREHPEVTPPGGHLKYTVARALNRWLEGRTLRQASGIISVSAGYPRLIAKEFPGLCPPHLVQPFPVNTDDFALIRKTQDHRGRTNTECTEWTYVGRGGEDMRRSCSIFFRWLRAQPPGSNRVRLIGTSYAGTGRARTTLRDLAHELGVGELVTEDPDRVPFSEALRIIFHADALFIPGSDDPSYTASKIFPYLAAGKPTIAIFHEGSSVPEIMKTSRVGTCITFGADPESDIRALQQLNSLNPAMGAHGAGALPKEVLGRYGQDAQAKEIVRFLDELQSGSAAEPVGGSIA